jgi:hypothetical protein
MHIYNNIFKHYNKNGTIAPSTSLQRPEKLSDCANYGLFHNISNNFRAKLSKISNTIDVGTS